MWEDFTKISQEIYGIYFSCLSCNGFDLCFKCVRSKETLHPEHDFIQRGNEEWSSQESELMVGETSRTEERIEQNPAQDPEFEAYDSPHEILDDADDLLDLVERDLDGPRPGKDDATGGERGMKNDIGNE